MNRELAIAGLAGLVAVFLQGPLIAQGEGDFLSEEELFGDFDEALPSISDPLKPFNMAMFRFNDFLYVQVFDPIAKGYDFVTPEPLQVGVSNFFTNASYPVRLTSNLLQGRLKSGVRETGRFILNSTVGLAGFFTPADDVESLTSIPPEDIGQALGSWGIGEGFYLVLPVLGPSSARDLVGYVGDQVVHPLKWPAPYVLEPWTPRLILTGVEYLNDSPDLVNRYIAVVENTIDPYTAVKDAYVQNRRFSIER